LSAVSFWAAVLTLALPLSAHADPSNLSAYAVTANGYAFQPYLNSSAYANASILDEATPVVYVQIDNNPSADAKAAYFFPGNGANAVFTTNNVPAQIPNGVEARYPGTGSASQQTGPFTDGQTTVANAATQSAKAAEGYALAQAGVASYQFAPSALSQLPIPQPPTVPSPPPLPPVGSTPTPTPGGGGGGSATPTPTAKPSPSPTPICLTPPICLSQSIGYSPGARSKAARPGAQQTGYAAASRSTPRTSSPPPAQLPDNVEQALVASLRAAEVAHPGLLALSAHHQMAATTATLPYASADIASVAATRATNAGVSVAIQTHAANVQIFQGLITFAAVDSKLEAIVAAPPPPADPQLGSGKITTSIAGATIAGIPVTIDDQGIHVVDQNASANQVSSLSDQLTAALGQAGIAISVEQPATRADVGFWSGIGNAVNITATFGSSSVAGSNTAARFTLGEVDATMNASPAPAAGGIDIGGFCFFCGGFNPPDLGSPSSPGGTQTPSQPSSVTLPLGLSGGELLALVFVVQGISTAAVAATGGLANGAAQAGATPAEEESK
jgi:hypothetical protein